MCTMEQTHFNCSNFFQYAAPLWNFDFHRNLNDWDTELYSLLSLENFYLSPSLLMRNVAAWKTGAIRTQVPLYPANVTGNL